MSFDVDTHADLRTAILTALRNNVPGLDTSTHGDEYLKASAQAHVMEGLSKRLRWVSQQIFPDSADTENLGRHAALRGLTWKDPTQAEGTARFTGTPATPVPLGTVFSKADGVQYETTATDVIGLGGYVDLAAEAIETGADANCEAGEEFTLAIAPPGIDSDATAQSDFTGGTDRETDAALLVRLLARIQSPPAGGAAGDWEQWALEVDGVVEAYEFPRRRGVGTCDVVIFTEGAGGARALPGAGLLATVTAYIETKRPVTTKSFEVLAATPKAVSVRYDDLEVEDGYDPATVAAVAVDTIEALFPTLAPGETLHLVSDLDPAVAGVAGTKDWTRINPAANVDAEISSVQVEVLEAGVVAVNLP